MKFTIATIFAATASALQLQEAQETTTVLTELASSTNFDLQVKNEMG